MMLPIPCGERRKGIGSVLSGRMVFMKRWAPRTCRRVMRLHLVAVRTPRVQGGPVQRNRRASPKKEGGGIEIEGDPDDQLLRRPSAARFHCVTLSAIMRVDFIAAWLSWA
jgi:hypothetical protein